MERESSKECPAFFSWRLFIKKSSFEEFNFVFFTAERKVCSQRNQGSEVFVEFSGTFCSKFDWSVIFSSRSKYVLSKMNNHEHRTKQTHESYTFQPVTSFCINLVYGFALQEFSVAQVDGASARCLRGHRFESCRGLRLFHCHTLVIC